MKLIKLNEKHVFERTVKSERYVKNYNNYSVSSGHSKRKVAGISKTVKLCHKDKTAYIVLYKLQS